MRHRNAHRKLGRVSEHRTALLRNQAEALLAHEKIETTVPKAKELRPYVERLITIAKRGVKANDPKGVSLSARRLVMRDVLNETVVTELFDELAPRFMDRPGGYTVYQARHRRGDPPKSEIECSAARSIQDVVRIEECAERHLRRSRSRSSRIFSAAPARGKTIAAPENQDGDGLKTMPSSPPVVSRIHEPRKAAAR